MNCGDVARPPQQRIRDEVNEPGEVQSMGDWYGAEKKKKNG